MEKKMGRPPLPKGESKAAQIGVRFNPKEDKKLGKQAVDSGQSKSELVRDYTRLMLADSVICDKFTVEELDGKKVRFKFRMDASRTATGEGKFMAIKRGNGSLKIQIESSFAYDPPNKIVRFILKQPMVDWIKRLSSGHEFEFEVIDPSL